MHLCLPTPRAQTRHPRLPSSRPPSSLRPPFRRSKAHRGRERPARATSETLRNQTVIHARRRLSLGGGNGGGIGCGHLVHYHPTSRPQQVTRRVRTALESIFTAFRGQHSAFRHNHLWRFLHFPALCIYLTHILPTIHPVYSSIHHWCLAFDATIAAVR
jgi:hypothetical protein